MTTKDDDGSLGAEVSSRLDELFGDDDSEEIGVSLDSSDVVSVAGESKSTAKAAAKPNVETDADNLDADSPIRNLKALSFSEKIQHCFIGNFPVN